MNSSRHDWIFKNMLKMLSFKRCSKNNCKFLLFFDLLKQFVSNRKSYKNLLNFRNCFFSFFYFYVFNNIFGQTIGYNFLPIIFGYYFLPNPDTFIKFQSKNILIFPIFPIFDLIFFKSVNECL